MVAPVSPGTVPPVSNPHALADEAAAAVADATGVDRHDIAVVLGSGWMPAADVLGDVVAEVPTNGLPGFAPSTVAGHPGIVRSLRTAAGRRVLAFVGRVHGYEGHSPGAVVHGVRTAHAAGCTAAVLTNAAGGIKEGFRVGHPVLIADHINLTGDSPLGGTAMAEAADEGRPSHFADLTDAYSPRLRVLAREVDGALAEGVYAGLSGPQYETPAEVRMLGRLGADLVGMSTVWETIAARHLGLEVLGLSLVTNLAAGLGDVPLDHGDVLAAGRSAAARMRALLAGVVDRL
jgi:purine-nucleoside phosphorylase